MPVKIPMISHFMVPCTQKNACTGVLFSTARTQIAELIHDREQSLDSQNTQNELLIINFFFWSDGKVKPVVSLQTIEYLSTISNHKWSNDDYLNAHLTDITKLPTFSCRTFSIWAGIISIRSSRRNRLYDETPDQQRLCQVIDRPAGGVHHHRSRCLWFSIIHLFRAYCSPRECEIDLPVRYILRALGVKWITFLFSDIHFQI